MKKNCAFVLAAVLLFTTSEVLFGQDEKEIFQLSKGSILTNFSLSFTGGRGDNANFRTFDVSLYSLSGFYMISDHIGVGPRFSHGRQSIQGGTPVLREWVFDYGVQTGYFREVSTQNDQPMIAFVNAGVSRNRREFDTDSEFFSQVSDPEYDPSYFIGAGIIKSLGKRIAVRLEFARTATKEDTYVFIGEPDANGIGTIERRDSWEDTYALSAGFTLTF